MSEAYFVLFLFTISCVLYLFELAWIWVGLYYYRPNSQHDFETPLTLIIAARDEEQNLNENLIHWLSQKHKSYEVLVVNDCSDDDFCFAHSEP